MVPGDTHWSNQNPESWSVGLLPKEPVVLEHKALPGQSPTSLELRQASLQQAFFNFKNCFTEKENKRKNVLK